MLNARERLTLLRLLDGLEPAHDGISVTFTLAPTWRDDALGAEYRLGWEACVSEIKSVLLPILGFAREFWAKRRAAINKASSARRQARIDAGMCEVWTCEKRATDGTMCRPHADTRRDQVGQRVKERRDRTSEAVADRARLGSLRPERWIDDAGAGKVPRRRAPAAGRAKGGRQ